MRTTMTLIAGLALTTAVRAADEPKAVIEKAITAAGGADKLAKARQQSWKAKSKMMSGGQEATGTVNYLFGQPDLFRLDREIVRGNQTVKITAATDGKTSWEQTGDAMQEMAKDKAAEFQHTVYVLYVSQLLPLRDKAFTLTAAGESKHGDRTLLGLKVSHAGKRDVTLYFDPKTHLLAKSSTVERDEWQGYKEVPHEEVIESYMDVDGMKVPAKLSIYRGGDLSIVQEYSGWTVSDKVDAKKFAKP